MRWDDLRIFLAVADASSLSEAATTLAVNQSTVSRRMAALERQLGAQLIERSSAGHVLTASGLELLPVARNIAEEFDRIDRQVVGRDARLGGRLRVTCVDVMVERYLAPHLAQFCERHPDIELSIVTPFQPVDLTRREADVAIRASDNPPEFLVGRRLFSFALGVYGSPRHHGGLPGVADPSELNWIGWESDHYNDRMIASQFPSAKVHHRVDSLLVASSMVRAGLGVSVFPCYWADQDEELVRIYPEPVEQTALGLWVLTHPDVNRAARVRAFTQFITEIFLSDRDLFEGRGPRRILLQRSTPTL